jgi:hypothetical protein
LFQGVIRCSQGVGQVDEHFPHGWTRFAHTIRCRRHTEPRRLVPRWCESCPTLSGRWCQESDSWQIHDNWFGLHFCRAPAWHERCCFFSKRAKRLGEFLAW